MADVEVLVDDAARHVHERAVLPSLRHCGDVGGLQDAVVRPQAPPPGLCSQTLPWGGAGSRESVMLATGCSWKGVSTTPLKMAEKYRIPWDAKHHLSIGGGNHFPKCIKHNS